MTESNANQVSNSPGATASDGDKNDAHGIVALKYLQGLVSLRERCLPIDSGMWNSSVV